MIDSYKNIERLRYRLNSDLNEIKESIDKNSNKWYKEMLQQISSAIISAMAASAIIESNFSSIQKFFGNIINIICKNCFFNSIISWILSSMVFIGIYILLYILVKVLLNKIIYIKKNNDIVRQAKVDYQKEFDNIACDSIFVAFEYKENYENFNLSNKNLKTFYYYEVIHYLESACFITRDLCKHKDRYIKINNKTMGVDLYRVYNMIKLMEDILEFAFSEQNNINAREEDKVKVKESISNISRVIQDEIITIITTMG